MKNDEEKTPLCLASSSQEKELLLKMQTQLTPLNKEECFLSEVKSGFIDFFQRTLF
jgi:hypothetical protein